MSAVPSTSQAPATEPAPTASPADRAPWLEGLNAAQLEAALHGEGPLLIVAGAGTGKTRTLVARVAQLVYAGVRPDRLLLLTFTRRAAAEMLRRAEQLAGSLVGGGSGWSGARPWGGTFHAVANRLLRVYGAAVGLPQDFNVIDQSDAADVMAMVRTELGVARKDRRFPRKETLVSI
jgi:DNA helicase-2/ATP-dependent DNA helicase PcrA